MSCISGLAGLGDRGPPTTVESRQTRLEHGHSELPLGHPAGAPSSTSAPIRNGGSGTDGARVLLVRLTTPRQLRCRRNLRPVSGWSSRSGHAIECSATDAAGQTGFSRQFVTVRDSTAPVVTVPANITVQPTAPRCDSDVPSCDGDRPRRRGFPPPRLCSPGFGHLPGSGGTRLVTCTASDGAATPAPATLLDLRSNPHAPVVTVPASRTVEANGPNGSIVNYETPTATSVDGPLLATCTKASGSVFPLGPTTVTCSATDNGGRTGSAAFTIAVVETTRRCSPFRPPRDPVEFDGRGEQFGDPGLLGGAKATDIVDNSDEMSHNAPAIPLRHDHRRLHRRRRRGE